jgi:hypothetical protein
MAASVTYTHARRTQPRSKCANRRLKLTATL